MSAALATAETTGSLDASAPRSGDANARHWGDVSPRRQRRPATPALTLAGVGKIYATHGAVEAVRTVDLEVAPGELVAVLGPRGSGTSTLLAMIAGLETPTSGRIASRGRRVRNPGMDRPLLFSDAGVLPWLDARQNVEVALRERRLAAFERAAIARRCLDLVSLHHLEHTRASDLSLGQQQRVALARALAGDPTVVLLDAPFTALDPRTRASLHKPARATCSASTRAA